jgi:DNA replication protein DnaC
MSAKIKTGGEDDGGEVKDPTAMLLRSFRLPTMAGQYEEVMQRAEKEGWSHRQVLRHLCESEAVDRGQRRTARLLGGSGLPESKTLSSLDEGKLPMKVRRQLPALIEGGFVDRAANVLVFGLPGRGKTHFLAALGRELILRHSKRVLFRPAFKIVGQLLAAKRDLCLEKELKKLDRYDVLILDDIGYLQQSREEMEVLFTLLAERYERRSVLLSSNLVFSQWDQIFKDPMTTMAAIDRLVHHSIILEFDGPSQRIQKAAGADEVQEAGKTSPDPKSSES